MTDRERALALALQRLLAECPDSDGHWPPYDAARKNATALLAGAVTPEAYLKVTHP